MSSTPLVRWSFALPSGSATRPSATTGLFQCPGPASRAARSLPVAGAVDVELAGVDVVDPEQAAGDDRARAVPGDAPAQMQAPAAQDVGGGAAAAGHEHRAARDGRCAEELRPGRCVDPLELAAGGRNGRADARPSRRASASRRRIPSLPPVTARPPGSRAGALEPRSVSVASSWACSSGCRPGAGGGWRRRARARCRRSRSVRRRARCRSRPAGAGARLDDGAGAGPDRRVAGGAGRRDEEPPPVGAEGVEHGDRRGRCAGDVTTCP